MFKEYEYFDSDGNMVVALGETMEDHLERVRNLERTILCQSFKIAQLEARLQKYEQQ